MTDVAPADGRALVPGSLHHFVPNLLLVCTISALVAIFIGPRMQPAKWVLATWLLAQTVPLAYTWTKGLGGGTRGCHMGVPPWEFCMGADNGEILLNVMLFVPAGAAAFLWPDGPHRLAALGVGLSIPLTVELGQYLVPQLERSCQLGDVLNNQIGVVLGWSLAAGAWSVARSWSAVDPRQRPDA
ncbi:MAG: VanZ family protein [Candidatus Nanopelagicales bacterium]